MTAQSPRTIRRRVGASFSTAVLIASGLTTVATVVAPSAALAVPASCAAGSDPGPAITSGNAVNFEVQQTSDFFQICATGTPAPAITETGALPSGVMLTDAGDGSATLTGAPAAGTEGTYPLILTASNGMGPDATQPFTLNVTKDDSSTELSKDVSPVTAGEAVTLTATVGGFPGGVDPTGTVDFTDNSVAIPTCTAVAVSTTTSVTTATCATTFTSADHQLKATYNGDTDYTSSSKTLDIIVADTASSMDLESSLTPSTYGQAETATATITPADAAGSVQFNVNGSPLGAPVFVSSGTATSLTLANATPGPLPAGDNVVTATFSPTDALALTTATGTLHQIVAKADTATTIGINANEIAAVVASVAPGSGTPTGTVEFFSGGVSLGSKPLVNGVATYPGHLKSGQNYALSATYSGDANDNPSSDSTARNDPTVTTAVTSQATKTKYGWFNKPVTVTFTCTTNGSPLTKPCPTPVTLKKNAGGQSVARTIMAKDGGSATAVVSPINIDQVKPKVRVKGPVDGATYDGGLPGITCVGHDSLSGIADCSSGAGGPQFGRQFFSATATDKAGNVASVRGHAKVLQYFVTRATYRHGAFDVKVGTTYTVAIVAAHQPRYYDAAPVDSQQPTPFKKGPLMTRLHKGLSIWTTDIAITHQMSHHRVWNIGAKEGKTLHVVKIRLHGGLLG